MAHHEEQPTGILAVFRTMPAARSPARPAARTARIPAPKFGRIGMKRFAARLTPESVRSSPVEPGSASTAPSSASPTPGMNPAAIAPLTSAAPPAPIPPCDFPHRAADVFYFTNSLPKILPVSPSIVHLYDEKELTTNGFLLEIR